jgi:hypothetical protein
MLPGNWGVYAVLDQQIWLADKDPEKRANVFVRVLGSPPDRNAFTGFQRMNSIGFSRCCD